jgi:hypothetical protein
LQQAQVNPEPHENDAEGLADSLQSDQTSARIRRTRKNSLRAKPGGDARGAVANERDLSPLARLMGALGTEEIEFLLIGMSAAIFQGVPGSTIDVDFWINLPARQYMRPMNIALAQGAKMLRNTVLELSDGTLVNFVYSVTGLASFANEYGKAMWLPFHGLTIAVLPLERIRKSKLAIGRPKDLVHVQQIQSTLKLKSVKGPRR